LRAPDTVWIQSRLPVRPEFTAALSQAGAAIADALPHALELIAGRAARH
jgi:hypothetical protein